MISYKYAFTYGLPEGIIPELVASYEAALYELEHAIKLKDQGAPYVYDWTDHIVSPDEFIQQKIKKINGITAYICRRLEVKSENNG